MKEAIRSGEITVNKAKKIVPVLTAANKDAWLKLASTETSRTIEKAVATENPKLATIESLKYKAADRLELILGVGEKWVELLARVKDLESQRMQNAVSTEDALFAAMTTFIDRNDPIKKASREKVRAEKGHASPSDETSGRIVKPDSKDSHVRTAEWAYELSVTRRITKVPRQRIAAAIKQAVILRDESQCVYRDGAKHRCAQRRWLDVHHVVPIAAGGSNEISNLQTLCSAHHRLIHARE